MGLEITGTDMISFGSRRYTGAAGGRQNWRKRGAPLLGRLAVLLFAAACLVFSAFAQAPAKVTVADQLFAPDGSYAQGTITITSAQTFTSADNFVVPLGQRVTVTLNATGNFSIALVPNAGSTPSGTYYTADYYTTTKRFTETWIIPASGPVKLINIRTAAAPSPLLSMPFAQLTSPANCLSLGGFPQWTGLSWTCNTGGGPSTGLFTGGTATLRSTLTKIAAMQTAPPAKLRVLVWGDSVAGFHANAVAAGLRDSFGNAGVDISCQGTIPTGQGGSCVTNDAFSGGAAIIDGSSLPYDYTRSPTGVYYIIPAGGCVTWGIGGGYFTANQLSLLYVKEPGAGSLQFNTNKNGAGFVMQSTTSAANATTIGSVATATMPDTGPYKIQACATGATVNVFGPTFENSTINGAVLILIARGGLDLNQVDLCPTAVTAPWYSALAPDIVTFEMKEATTNGVYSDGSTFLSHLSTFRANWKTANPQVDFLFIGSSPVLSSNSEQLGNNATTRTVAQANNDVYWDGYYPTIDYPTQKALGWITDVGSPHQTTLGQVAESNLLWQQLGFGVFLNGASPRGIANASSTVTSLTFNTDITGLNTPGGKIQAIDTSDLYVRPTRGLQLQDLSNNSFGTLASTRNSFGQSTNYLPPFQTAGFSASDGVRGPSIGAIDANTVGIFLNPGAGSTNNLNAKVFNGLRYRVGYGATPYSGADAAIVLTSGWGTGPSVSAATGFDQGFSFSVTCGTTPGANPVITVTFKDGTWTAAPQYMVSRNDVVAPTPATFFPTWVEAATTLTITMQGTCTAGNVYKFKAIAMGN